MLHERHGIDAGEHPFLHRADDGLDWPSGKAKRWANSISRALPNALPIYFRRARSERSRASIFVWTLSCIAAYCANPY